MYSLYFIFFTLIFKNKIFYIFILILDEVRVYARRLEEAGVAVSYDEVAGAIHAFDMDDNPLAHAFTALQTEFVRRHVG